MASNSEWVIPAGADARRYFVLEVADTVKQDTTYFGKIDEQMRKGGREALLHFLLNRDLSDFNIRAVPVTEALQDQRARSRRGVDLLVEMLAAEGRLPSVHSSAHPNVAITSGEDKGEGFWPKARVLVPGLKHESSRVIQRTLKNVGAVRSGTATAGTASNSHHCRSCGGGSIGSMGSKIGVSRRSGGAMLATTERAPPAPPTSPALFFKGLLGLLRVSWGRWGRSRTAGALAGALAVQFDMKKCRIFLARGRWGRWGPAQTASNFREPDRRRRIMKPNITAAHATVELLAATWPRCFSIAFASRKPLKVGIGKEIAAATEGALTPEELDAAMRLYTGAKGYLRTLQEGAQRVDLDGAPAGPVSATEAAFARKRIERIEARDSARTRASGLAKQATALKAMAEAEAARKAGEEAQREAEVRAGKRKALLTLPRPAAASAAA